MKSRQPKLDSINESMARYRRESKLDGNQVPKSLEVRVKSLNEDWRCIASLTAALFGARVRSVGRQVEEPVIEEVKQRSVEADISLASFDDWKEGMPKISCYF